MKFDAPPDSNHPDVALRPITTADLPASLGDLRQREVFEHTSWNDPGPDDLAPYVGSATAQSPGTLMRLAIADRRSDALVGTIGFHTVVPLHRSAELAYDLSPQVWGRGIATHLCKRMVDWAHRQADVLRVQATVLESNVRSLRVLARAGFRNEGLLQSYRIVRGRPGNFFMHAHVVDARAGLAPPRMPSTSLRPTLRSANAADAPSVAALLIDTRAAFMPYAPSAHSDDDIRAWVANALIPSGGVVVAESDGRVVAVMATEASEAQSWITQMAVDPALVGNGIGSGLLAHAVHVLSPPIHLYTFQANHRARRFYERHGFVAVALTDGHANEERCPDVLYALPAKESTNFTNHRAPSIGTRRRHPVRSPRPTPDDRIIGHRRPIEQCAARRGHPADPSAA